MLSSVSDSPSNIYYGIDGSANISCIKVGKAKGNGTFTINFTAGTNVTKVVVTGFGWVSATSVNTLVVGDASAQAIVNATSWDSNKTDGIDLSTYNIADYEYSITPSNSVTFTSFPSATTNAGRVFITKIAIYGTHVA